MAMADLESEDFVLGQKSQKIKDSEKHHLQNYLWNESRGLCYYCDCEMVVWGQWRNWSKRKDRRGKTMPGNAATIDHVTPLSRGGSSQRDNLVMCCNKCNKEKADKTIREFMKPIEEISEQPTNGEKL